MALVWMEGFDFYTNTQPPLRGWSAGSFNSMAAGRFGGQCGVLSTVSRTRALPSNYSTIIAGFALKAAAVISTGNFFSLRAGATNTCQLSLDASSHLVVKNSAGTTIATGTTALSALVWYYIEIKLVINGASGTVEVHLNGNAATPEIASTTGNFGSSNIDTIFANNVSNGINTSFDDMYALDTTGSAPRNTFLGDVRIATIDPTGAGAHSQFTANGAANNWDCVDDATPDDDSTYVSDSTPGHYDTYVCSDIDGGASVYGVQTHIYARKDDAGSRQLAPVIRMSSVDYDGTTVTMASSYAFYSQLYERDPTPADWTAANVNNAEYGVKEVA